MDRLDPATAKCAVEANQHESLWFWANAANTRSGSLLFIKAHGNDSDASRLEVWRGCEPSDRITIPIKVAVARHLNVSETGHYAVVGGPGTGVEVLDLENGKSIAYLGNCYGPGLVMPDERFALITCLGKGIEIFSFAEKAFRPRGGSTPRIEGHAFAYDKKFKRLAIGESDGKVVLLEVQRTDADTIALVNPRAIQQGRNDWVSGMAFSSSGEELYGFFRDGRLEVWELPSGKRVHSWKTNLNTVSSVTFFKQATRVFISGAHGNLGGDPAVVVMSTATGKVRWIDSNQNQLWGAYFPRSDEMFVGGITGAPTLLEKASVLP